MEVTTRTGFVREEASMAGVDVGTGGDKRAVNQEINMIPFIDLLLVTVAFLLITAVWVTFSRIETNAQVPNISDGPIDIPKPSKDLHLYARDGEFSLAWKQGSTVIAETRLPRRAVPSGESTRYDELAEHIAKQWHEHGSHRDPSDRVIDRCVFHSDNSMPFKEIVAVMDAIYEAKREMVFPSGKRRKVPVFNMAFASR